jgi:hypothetical protein
MKKGYTPLYFLASLGFGGLAVSFFIYLMFMIEHKGTPMVTFDHLWPVLQNGPIGLQALIIICMVAIAVLGINHYRLLIWNVKQYKMFKETEAFKDLKSGNAEVILMSLPLTFAMAINVGFVLGAVFVPGLWGIVEFMFPFALLGFMACGYYALKIYGEYMIRIIKNGGFSFEANNNFSQLVAIFAFSMVGVGFAAPGAMSHHIEINAIGIFFAIMFTAISFILGLMKFTLGLKSMLKNGIALETSPTVWIIIPILTLVGITLIRISFGLDHHFNSPMSGSTLFVLTSTVFALQIVFGVLGYKILKSLGYFDKFVYGDGKSAGSYALICPGVAFFVFGMFFLHFGLVKTGVFDLFSIPYFIILLPMVYIQIQTIKTVFTLNAKHFNDEE